MIKKQDSQHLQFNHYCGLFITSLNFACRDFNVKLKLCAIIKFMAKLKVTQLENFPLMSRQLTACRDITQWWEDNKSLGRDIRHFMTF